MGVTTFINTHIPYTYIHTYIHIYIYILYIYIYMNILFIHILRKPAGRHLSRVRFANEMRKGGVGGEAGETAQKIRYSGVNWVGAGVFFPGDVPCGNLATVAYRFLTGRSPGTVKMYVLRWQKREGVRSCGTVKMYVFEVCVVEGVGQGLALDRSRLGVWCGSVFVLVSCVWCVMLAVFGVCIGRSGHGMYVRGCMWGRWCRGSGWPENIFVNNGWTETSVGVSQGL